MNPKAKLPTDAIRVTRDQLSIILHQSYIHGSEHGWKANIALAKDRLQAEYEEDMRNATTKFEKHEKHIRGEEFNRGFEDGSSECKAQLAALQTSLIAKYDLQHLGTLEHFSERCQEEYDQGYKVGYDTGIREGNECRKTAQLLQVHSSTQTEWPELTTATVSVQTSPPIARTTSSATTSTQTEYIAYHHHEMATTVTAAVQSSPYTPVINAYKPFHKLATNYDDASTQTSCHIIQSPSSSPTAVPSIPSTSPETIGSQTETAMSQHLEIGYATRVATLQSSVLFGNRKNTKTGTTSENCCEISPYNTVFSSPTPSAAPSNSSAPSITTIALETRSTMTNFAQKHEKIKKLSISTQTTPKTVAPSVIEAINEVSEVYASSPTPNDAILQPSTLSSTASSSQPPASSGHEKSGPLRAIFESQAPVESPASICIVTGLKTRSEPDGFTKNCQIFEKSPIFIQKTPEPCVSTCFNWADDAVQLPIAPTKQLHDLAPGNSSKTAKFTQENAKLPVLEYFNHAESLLLPPKTPPNYPRDLSGLRSPSTNPFLSLRRRYHQSRNSYRFNRLRPQNNYFKHSYYHHSVPRAPVHSSLPPISASIDWDRDPCLFELSRVLRTLGWSRP